MDIIVPDRRRRQRRVPDDKRKRAAQACAQCKARKSKCIRSTSGACQRCSRSSLVCEYRQKKGHGPNVETRSPTTVTPVAADASPAPNFATDACQAERFMWPGFLAKLRESFSLDPLPDVEHAVLDRTPMPSVERKLRAAELKRLDQATSAFPQRSIAEHLVTVLIEHGTDSFFYFDQAELSFELDKFYTSPGSDLRYNAGFVCLALAAFALGSQWTALHGSNSSSPLQGEDLDFLGRSCYEQARLLIPDLDNSLSLQSVQASFLLGVYLLPENAIGSLHMYLGLALRKAMALDLHVHAQKTYGSEREREIRSRLWWAIFSLERTLTVKLNRPRSVDPNIMTTSLPRPLQSLDSTQLFDNSLHQTANAQLTLILDQLPDSSKWTDRSDAAIRARTALKAWKQSLPPVLRLENIPSASASYRAVFHLHLNYYFAWIAMGKFQVVAFVRRCLREAAESMFFGVEDTTMQLYKSCIKAAKKMLELFGNIDRSGNVTRSSFTDFQGCSIATMIMLIAGILERDLCYEARILFGLSCLRRMAGDNVAATNGVHFMEALKSIADEAAEKLRNFNMTTRDRAASALPPNATSRPQNTSPSVHWDSTAPLPQPLDATADSTTSYDQWTDESRTWLATESTHGDPFSLLQFDNEAFLMELTDIEMRGISGS